MVLINQFINFKIGGVTVSANSTELNYNAGVIAGTALADKVLVLDTSKDVSGINHLSASQLTGTLLTAAQPNITSLGSINDIFKVSSGESILGADGLGYLRITQVGGLIYLQPASDDFTGAFGTMFITNYGQDTGTSSRVTTFNWDGKVGIQTIIPSKQLTVNHPTGECLRLTYNAHNGSPTYYSDLDVNSSGDLVITTIGDFTTVNKQLKVLDAISNFNTGGVLIRSLDNTFGSGRTIQKEVISTINITEYNPAGLTDDYTVEIWGYIKPLYTQTYTFYIGHDDNCRLFINGTLIYQEWSSGNITGAVSSTIGLTENIWYPIYIIVSEGIGGQKVILEWSSLSQTQEIVPAINLAWDDKIPPVFSNTNVVGNLTIHNPTEETSKNCSFTVDTGGDLTITPSGGDVTITGSLLLTTGVINKVVDIDLTTAGYVNTNFYPIALNRTTFGSHDRVPMITFQIGGESLGTGDSYNENSLHGLARGGGWSDHVPSAEVTILNHTNSEHRFLAIYEGTAAFTYGIVIYVRGGYEYSINTDASDIVIGTSGAALTQSTSVFPIKDINLADITGTAANISKIIDLNVSSGKHMSRPLYLTGNNDLLNLTNTSSTGRASMRFTSDNDNYEHGMRGSTHSSAPNGLYWYNDATRMVLTQDGKLGIGTDAPTSPLHILNVSSDPVNTVLTLDSGNGSSSTGLSLDFSNDGGSLVTGRINNYKYGGGDFGLSFSNWDSSLKEHMVLRNASVGIGTNDPQVKLHVRSVSSDPVNTAFTLDSLNGSNATGISMDFVNHSSYLVTGRINNYKYGGGDFGLVFSNYDSSLKEHMVLRNTGVGIGTNNPDKSLEVNSSSGNCLRLTYNDSNGSAVNYTDFTVSSSGDLTVNASGGDITMNGRTMFGSNGLKMGSYADVLTSDNMFLVGDNASPARRTAWGMYDNSRSQVFIEMLHTNNTNNDVSMSFYTSSNSSTSATEKMRLTHDGNFGINTTTPDEKLNVYQGNIKLGDNNAYANDSYIYKHWFSTPITHSIGMQFDYYTGSGSNSTTHSRLMFVSNAEDNQEIYDAGKQTMMTILSNGLVGIGTVSPTEKLHIKSSGPVKIRLEADTDNSNEADNVGILLSQDGGTYTSYVGQEGNSAQTMTDSFFNALLLGTTGIAAPLQLGTNSAIRMTIESGGNVGIGTNNPTVELDVKGNCIIGNKSSSQYIYLKSSATDTRIFSHSNGVMYYQTSGSMFFKADGITDTTNSTLFLETGGNVGIGTDNPGVALDIQRTGTNCDVRILRTDSNGCDLRLKSQDNKARLTYDGGYFQIDRDNAGTAVIMCLANGLVGINSYNPDKQLEINSTTGDCLRLTYNGSALYYADFAVNSSGHLHMTPSGDATVHNGRFIIEQSHIEALMVRKSGDTGDVFTVNTSSSIVDMNAKMGINTSAPGADIHIKQSADNSTGGIRFERDTTTNYWNQFISTGNGLDFAFEGTVKGYLSSVSNVSNIDFTGQHRSSTDNTLINNDVSKYIGLIVSSTGVYNNINGGELNINEALPKVDLSNCIKDKKVYGVISDREDNDGERAYELGTFVTVVDKIEGDERLIVNSVGEGMVWVCNKIERVITKKIIIKTITINNTTSIKDNTKTTEVIEKSSINTITKTESSLVADEDIPQDEITENDMIIEEELVVSDPLITITEDVSPTEIEKDSNETEEITEEIEEIEINDEEFELGAIFENGDFITTCEVSGYGMKQDDDLFHNYTVGKITQNCDFSNPDRYVDELGKEITKKEYESNGGYKSCFVGCVYYCG